MERKRMKKNIRKAREELINKKGAWTVNIEIMSGWGTISTRERGMGLRPKKKTNR
jgi:hypothetical protein